MAVDRSRVFLVRGQAAGTLIGSEAQRRSTRRGSVIGAGWGSEISKAWGTRTRVASNDAKRTLPGSVSWTRRKVRSSSCP